MGGKEHSREKERVANRPTASLQLRLVPDGIPWVFSSLMNQPQVDLYDGEFSEPFTQLVYRAQHSQGQLVLMAALGVGEEFNSRYGNTIGSPQDLEPFLRRYPEHEFTPDGSGLIIKQDGQTHGIIGRTTENQIFIQRGGQAGQLPIDSGTPVNNLSLHLDKFNLLVQRYVSAIWKASPETDQKQLQLVLSVPAIPEGAPTTYFSTFEILAKEYRGRPRQLSLEDIGGYSQIKDVIKGLVMDTSQPEISRKFGSHPYSNRFILVTGKEGTGKSLPPKALDAMLRGRFGTDKFEHYRLPLQDMLTKHGSYAAVIVTTFLDHIRENEKKGIPTLLHLDSLHVLVPPGQKPRTNGGTFLTSGVSIISPAELAYYSQAIEPIIVALRQFGTDLGGESHWTIVYGESRAKRDELPEEVARTFRRVFHLTPDNADLEDIVRVQIRYTRAFAQKTQRDPFSPDIEQDIPAIAQTASGLVGRDIQQALINIITENKAIWDGDEGNLPLITAEKFADELRKIRLTRGFKEQQNRPVGFDLSATRRQS
ncbi:MAG: hypothetical protein Q8P89_01395 [bacterium]|nr:hypothetical protein [bacterium]